MSDQTILIIEDDLRLATFTRMSLETQGYQTHLTVTGAEGFKQLSCQKIDLILLDLELPDGNGIQLCQKIRKQWNTPVIIFSAERSVETKIQALEAGANDYIVKPVDVRELLARVKAQLRAYLLKNTCLQIGLLRFDQSQDLFFCNQLPLILSEMEHKLLKVFFIHSPDLLSKADLYSQIWEGAFLPDRDAHLVETHINRLRNRLKKWPTQCQIQTVYGKGYFLRSC